jgi:repressor LexA
VVRLYVETYGFAARTLGISGFGPFDLIATLVALECAFGVAAAAVGLPLVGKVAAGSPILAQENVLRTPAVDPLLFKPRADYLLEVRGMSMRDAGILDGDWLAVHKQAQADNGQVVVARLDDEVTVKRLKLRGARAELVAENPDYSPIVLDLRREPLVIEGIAVGVIRPSL